ncbi:hypothetical protein AAES_158505 [Amazona aestiva]|uniref:Chromatin assembly factor 1 subunit p150 C-terminal domain-containing protein n=1 Tax=Amazona aestiva TaxID=12930 RepID=A0A0Q3T102_AMAAE|nr:hypothetical protein AAES_158505 [Amazona aestiva]
MSHLKLCLPVMTLYAEIVAWIYGLHRSSDSSPQAGPVEYLSEDEGVTEECDPENQKIHQKLKAKEWDELMGKGKRFHVPQSVKIGCIWEGAEYDSSTNADLKVLQQFTACALDSPIAEEEQQVQKYSKKRAN